jgi:hypothetical protein
MSMAHSLRPVELDFADTAPVRLVFGAGMTADPAAVHHALADEDRTADWAQWFTGVVAATPAPGGRQVRLSGGTVFWETVLADDPGRRYTYRTDRTNAPGARALLEDWRLEPAGGGTRILWTVAADGTAAYRAFLRLARPGLGQVFRRSVRNLDRTLVH